MSFFSLDMNNEFLRQRTCQLTVKYMQFSTRTFGYVITSLHTEYTASRPMDPVSKYFTDKHVKKMMKCISFITPNFERLGVK